LTFEDARKNWDDLGIFLFFFKAFKVSKAIGVRRLLVLLAFSFFSS
jgi:hypothetical protein